MVEVAVRGSEGLSICDGSSLNSSISIDTCSGCRVMTLSTDGSWLAWCNGTNVQVLDLNTRTVRCSLDKPKTRYMTFSPKGTYLCAWEPYAIRTGESTGKPNLEIYRGDKKVAEFTQKKAQSWSPQWSEDEQLCARNVTNEVHCFDGGQPGRQVDHKLQIANLELFALSPGTPPYKMAVYVPGTKGAPSFVRLYEYPRLDTSAIVASKSFYRADTVRFYWNRKGSAVLVVTTTEVDKTGASYYGEQGLYYLSAKGEGINVLLDKKGPIYEVEWSPDSTQFCVVYGFMPGKAMLFNCKCEAVYDFGTGHRNTASYNPQGTILCLAGFGNLRGNMEFWNTSNLKLITKAQASDSTSFEWSPDGAHVVTATTAPRLREGNGYKLWHFSGTMMLHHETPPKQELWEVKWRPIVEPFPPPDLTARPASSTVEPVKQEVKKQAYRPPGLRDKPYTYKLHDEVESAHAPGGSGTSSKELSKSAQKNKKKRENKMKAKEEAGSGSSKSQEQKDALDVASYLMSNRDQPQATPTVTTPIENGNPEKEKKLKNLKKKLRQIELLKQQQQEGKALEGNQVEKLKTESSLLEEIAKLELQ